MSIFVDESNTNTDTKKFMDYLKISHVTYFNRGAYGIGYRAKINDLVNSKYNVISLNNTEQSIKCGQLFVKLVPILDDTDIGLSNLLMEVSNMEFTSSNSFINEIRIQTDIYKKTNNNLEAVCPAVVYSQVINNTDIKSRAINMLSIMLDNMPNDDNKVFLYNIKSLYEANKNMKLGVIAMSFAENYDTLWDVMKRTTNVAQKIMYQYLAVYELLRLYDIGYMHGDYHMKNILINTQYKYSNLDNVYLGRCLIIDFGLAFKNKYMKTKETDTPSVKLNIMAQEKTPLTNENAYSWHSYKWLLDFLQSENDVNLGYDNLKQSIVDFQNQMIQLINENYPGIIERIRAINSSKYRGSILKGGRAIVGTLPGVAVDTMIEPAKINNVKVNAISKQTNDIVSLFTNNNNVISATEFEQIFNPGNMDINKVVDNYENTIQEGIIILDNNMNTGGKKMKKKKTSKKKKSTKKNTTRKRKSTKKKKTI